MGVKYQPHKDGQQVDGAHAELTGDGASPWMVASRYSKTSLFSNTASTTEMTPSSDLYPHGLVRLNSHAGPSSRHICWCK